MTTPNPAPMSSCYECRVENKKSSWFEITVYMQFRVYLYSLTSYFQVKSTAFYAKKKAGKTALQKAQKAVKLDKAESNSNSSLPH